MLRKSIRCSYKFTQTLCIVSLKFCVYFLLLLLHHHHRRPMTRKNLRKEKKFLFLCAIDSFRKLYVSIDMDGYIYTHKVHCSVYIHAWKMKILASFRISSSSHSLSRSLASHVLLLPICV